MIVTYVSEGANTYRNHPTKSALEKSIIAINELFRLRKEIDGRTNEYGDTPSLNISTLHAGTMYTLHPSLSVFTIDRRMINGENLEQAKAEIIGLLDSLKAADPTMDYRWELHHERPGLLVPEDDPFVKICAEAYKEVTGRDVEFCMHNAGSGAANIRADCGISMPNWSGATGGMASKKDDRVNVEDMLEAVEYFMLTLVKAMG
jgi:acetylornithine deacetylase/succinyl-diaminopimelate desuccinylase-like protein